MLPAVVTSWAIRRAAKTLLLGAESRTGMRVYHLPNKLTGGRIMLVLTNVQQVTLTLEALDQYGNVAKIDGVPAWQVSDPAIGTITPAADGLSAVFVTTAVLGTIQVSAQADADLGAGVRPLTATLDIAVEASEAVALGLKAGVPEPK